MQIVVTQEISMIKSLLSGITSFLEERLLFDIANNSKLYQCQRPKPSTWL